MRLFSPARGAGVKPEASAPGRVRPTHPKPRRGAGRTPDRRSCLRPFRAFGEERTPVPGVETPGFTPAPLAGLESEEAEQSLIEVLQAMPPSPRPLRRRLPREDPPSDRGSAGVGEVSDLLLQLSLDRLGGADGAPFALSEVGPVVLAQADDVDLGGLRPVLSHLEGGGDPFLTVEPGEGFAAEALEAVAVVGVQVRTDEVAQGPLCSHVADVAGAREDEAEPEAEEGVRQVVVDGAG